MRLEGKAKMLWIHFGEDDKWHDKPLYRAIVEKCRELDLAGATVFRGIEGYGASTLIHRSHLLSFSSDAPLMVSVIDSEEKVQKLLPFLDEMVDEGLIAMSEVEVINTSTKTARARSQFAVKILDLLAVKFCGGNQPKSGKQKNAGGAGGDPVDE
jgi:PII-like signaling protein